MSTTVQKRQIQVLLAKAGITAKVTGAGTDWEVELPDERTHKLWKRLIEPQIGPTGGYKTGYGAWVMQADYQPTGDWNDSSSRWHYASGDDKLSKFEEGKPADPKQNMSPEDKAKWDKYHGKVEKVAKEGSYSGNPDGKPIYPNEIDHGYERPIPGGFDVVKQLQNNLLYEQGNLDMMRRIAERHLAGLSNDEKLSKFEEGKPADPTENMSDEQKKEWWKQHGENKDNFRKDAGNKTAAPNWQGAAKKLLDANKGTQQDDLHYRAYLRGVSTGQPTEHLTKKFPGAVKARQDLIDLAGKFASKKAALPSQALVDGLRKKGIELKDRRRIEDIVTKAGGEPSKMEALASRMAKSITGYAKAFRRAMAAEVVGYQNLAEIFFDRFETLVGMGKAAGTWQKLLTSENLHKLPPLYSTENDKDPMVWVKFFNAFGSGTWFITEFDGKDTMFGWAEIHPGNGELGYISLREISSLRKFGAPAIERDQGFRPKPLSQAKAEMRRNRGEKEASTSKTAGVEIQVADCFARYLFGNPQAALTDLQKLATRVKGFHVEPSGEAFNEIYEALATAFQDTIYHLTQTMGSHTVQVADCFTRYLIGDPLAAVKQLHRLAGMVRLPGLIPGKEFNTLFEVADKRLLKVIRDFLVIGGTSKMNLVAGLMKLAHENPELRKHLVPMLREAAAPTYQKYVEKKRRDGEKPLDKGAWERRVLNTGKAGDELKGDKENKRQLQDVVIKDATMENDSFLDLGKVKKNLENAGYQRYLSNLDKWLKRNHPDAITSHKMLKEDFFDAIGLGSEKKVQPHLPGAGWVPRKEHGGRLLQNWGSSGSKGERALSEIGKAMERGDSPDKETVDDALDQVKKWQKAKYFSADEENEHKEIERTLLKLQKKSLAKGDKPKVHKDDEKAIKDFAKDKSPKGHKLSDAQLMAKFLAKAKPETKERMKGVSPTEFKKMLGAIMDEEG